MSLVLLVIITDNYTHFQYIGSVKCTVSAEQVQTCSQPNNLKTVSTVF
jgi:hypothetical protein